MKKITYIDLGVWDGKEIDAFVEICTELNLEYKAIGFEPDIELFYKLYLKYKENKKVSILNAAIWRSTEICKLYKSKSSNFQGNSLFSTKNNIDLNEYNDCISIKISDILNSKILQEINILKFNIEGAELHLIEDLIVNNKTESINIFLGSTPDIEKVSEISNQMQRYNNLLSEAKIKIEKFYYKPEKEIFNPMKLNLKNKIIELL